MKREKVLIAVLLCFLLGNICKGYPTPFKGRKDASYLITTPVYDVEHLSRYVLQGTQTESFGAGYKLTPLPLDSSAPDPSNSVDDSGRQEERVGSIEEDPYSADGTPQSVFSGTEEYLQSQAKLGLNKQEESTIDAGATRKRFSESSKQPRVVDELSLRKQRATAFAERSQSIKDSPLHHKLRMISQGGLSRQLHAPTAKPNKPVHVSTPLVLETDRLPKFVAKFDQLKEGITKRPSNRNLGNGKNFGLMDREGLEKHRPTVIPSEDNRMPTDSSFKNGWNAQSSDDGDGTDEVSSVGGSDERWSHKTGVKQGPSWHLSAAAPMKDSKESRHQNDSKSENDGEERNGGQNTTKWRFSTKIPPKETHKPTNPSNKTDRRVKNSSLNHEEHNGKGFSRFSKEKRKGTSRIGKGKGGNLKVTAPPRRFSLVVPQPITPNPTHDAIKKNRSSKVRVVGPSQGGNITKPSWREKTTATAEGGVSSFAGVKHDINNTSRDGINISKVSGETANDVGFSDGRQASKSSKTTSFDKSPNSTDSSLEKNPLSVPAGKNDTNNGKSEESSSDGKDEQGAGATIHGVFFSRFGTTTEKNTSGPLRPGTQTVSMGVRWSVPHEPSKLPEGKYKMKKKEDPEVQDGDEENVSPVSAAPDRNKEDASRNSPVAFFAGLMVVAMVVPLIAMFIWGKCKSPLLRRNNDPENDNELGIVTPSMTNFGEELSDEEIIYERKPKGLNKTTTGSKPGDSAPSEQAVRFENSSKHAPNIWTMTDTPRSTPLMTLPIATDRKNADQFWMEDETSEMEHLLSPSGSSLSSEMSFERKDTAPSVAPTLVTPYAAMESKPQSQIKDDSSTSAEDCSLSTSTPSASFSNVPENVKSAVATESGITSAANESSKKPVSPVTDIVITIPDEGDLAEVVTSANERGSTRAAICPSRNYRNQEDVKKGQGNGDTKTEQSGKGLRLDTQPDKPADIVINIKDDEDKGLNQEPMTGETNDVVINIGDNEESRQELARGNNKGLKQGPFSGELRIPVSTRPSSPNPMSILREKGNVSAKSFCQDTKDSKHVRVSINEVQKAETVYPTGNSAVEKQQGYEVKGMEQTKQAMEKKPLSGESTDIVINILDEEESRQELASENEGWIGTKNYTNRNSHVERQKDLVAGKSSGLMETERAHQGLEREPFEGKSNVPHPPPPSRMKLSASSENNFTPSKSLTDMDENEVKRVVKRSASRRRIIHKASQSSFLDQRQKLSFSRGIAFAKSVILPESTRQKSKIKERSRVVKERVRNLRNPSFEEKIQIAASTINPDERTKDLNEKSAYKRKVIKMDAQMFKAHNEKSSFKMDMKFVRSVILGPSTTNHENDPQMGCLCYYCKKHWQKTGGPPCFKLPSRVSVAKDIVVFDGNLLYFPTPSKRSTFGTKDLGSHRAHVPVPAASGFAK